MDSRPDPCRPGASTSTLLGMPQDPAGGDQNHRPDDTAAAALDGVRRERRDRELARLVADQEGMVARRQLNRLGVDWDAVDAHVRARRWVERTPRVISTVTGTLTVGQLRWLALLHATDCEWDLPDGSVVVLEVQGPAHMEAPTWTADMRRHRRITAKSRLVVQCSSTELRDEPIEVALDLIALGVPGQLPGSAA